MDVDAVNAVRMNLARLLAAGQELRGCTEQEVVDLCAMVGERSLPDDYAEYLRLAGRVCGSLAAGSVVTYPSLGSMTDSARHHAAHLGVDKAMERLPCIAVLAHQGHTYLLLVVAGPHSGRLVPLDENPPHLHLDQPRSTFLEWLEDEVDIALEQR